MKWKFETDAQVHCSPCIADGDAVIGGCDGWLRLVNLADGEQRAGVKLDAIMSASPASAGGMFYIATLDGRMVAVDAEAARVRWEIKAPEQSVQFYASPAASGERVVFAGRDGIVRCLRAGDGGELWRFRARGQVDSSPVIVGGRVFFGSDDGTLYEVSLEDGRRLWSFEAGAAVKASAAIGAGRLVIGTKDGAVYCFGAPDRP